MKQTVSGFWYNRE